MPTSIQNKIKSIRELKNYTQEYLADQLGVSQASYNKIEKEKTTLSFARLSEIANILEVNVEDIITFDDHLSFNRYNLMKGNNNNNSDCNANLKDLYMDKIVLLEKLLRKTEQELGHYKGKFGDICEIK